MFQVFLLLALLFSIAFTIFIFVVFNRDKDETVEVYEEVRNPAIMQVLVPRENDKTPLASEQMFASLHGILRDNKKSLDMLSFEIISSGEEGIRFFIICPEHLVKFVEGQVYAQYPNAVIQHTNDPAQKPIRTMLSTGENYQAFVTAGEIELEKDFIFPVKTFRDFEVDPLAAITGAMGDLKEGEDVWLQLLVRPVGNYWQDQSKDYITAIKDGKDPSGSSGWGKFFTDMGSALASVNTSASAEESKGGKDVVRLKPGQEAELAQIEEKMLRPGFEIGIRIVTRAGDQFTSEQLLRNTIASFKQFTTAHLNGFVYKEPELSGEDVYNRYIQRYLTAEPMDIVNIAELASIYHLPNDSVETPNIHWSRARKSEPPLDLPLLGGDDEVAAFGETDYRGERMVFGLKRGDRRRHMYLLGKTGVGKSSTFKNMIVSDIMRGEGVCYIDPHGQDIDELLSFIPPQRAKDVVYFDPSDVNNPIGFNMLELQDLSQRDLVADGVVSVFKKQFEDSWGPRLQYILQNTVATCIEAQNTTILAVQRILIDKNYRKFVLKHVNDPILLKFWEDEYEKMSQNSRLITEAVAPIQNKVGRFISSAVIRNIVGQVKSTIDLREIMDNRKILLVNLAQGKIGEESAALLGGMFITRLQSAAMERVDIPEDDRVDFYLYVDEFQNFATDSFAKILSEARKFRLNLTMTNQYIEQIPLSVRHAIFGNVGTLSSFVVSQSDAALLANEFIPIFDAEDLVSLESHSMYVKLCIDGMTSTPFSAKSLDYKKRLEPFGQKEAIISQSRESYGVPRDDIEDKIRRWAMQSYSEKGNRSVMKDYDQQSSNKKKYDNNQGDKTSGYKGKKSSQDQKRKTDKNDYKNKNDNNKGGSQKRSDQKDRSSTNQNSSKQNQYKNNRSNQKSGKHNQNNNDDSNQKSGKQYQNDNLNQKSGNQYQNKNNDSNQNSNEKYQKNSSGPDHSSSKQDQKQKDNFSTSEIQNRSSQNQNDRNSNDPQENTERNDQYKSNSESSLKQEYTTSFQQDQQPLDQTQHSPEEYVSSKAPSNGGPYQQPTDSRTYPATPPSIEYAGDRSDQLPQRNDQNFQQKYAQPNIGTPSNDDKDEPPKHKPPIVIGPQG